MLWRETHLYARGSGCSHEATHGTESIANSPHENCTPVLILVSQTHRICNEHFTKIDSQTGNQDAAFSICQMYCYLDGQYFRSSFRCGSRRKFGKVSLSVVKERNLSLFKCYFSFQHNSFRMSLRLVQTLENHY